MNKEILIIALLSIVKIKPKRPIGFNLHTNMYIPLDDDSLEFVCGGQVSSISYLNDIVLSASGGIRFYDEDLSAASVLSIPLFGNKMERSARDFIRHISLSLHMAWEFAEISNLMIGLQVNFSFSGIGLGVMISKKIERCEIGGSCYYLKELEFFKEKTLVKKDLFCPISETNEKNYDEFTSKGGYNNLEIKNYRNVKNIKKALKGRNKRGFESSKFKDDKDLFKLAQQLEISLETQPNNEIFSSSKEEQFEILQNRYKKLQNNFDDRLKKHNLENIYESIKNNTEKNKILRDFNLQLALKACQEVFYSNFKDWIKLLKLEDLINENNKNEIKRTLKNFIEDQYYEQNDFFDKIDTKPDFIPHLKETLCFDSYFKDCYPKCRKQVIYDYITKRLDFQEKILKTYDTSAASDPQTLCTLLCKMYPEEFIRPSNNSLYDPKKYCLEYIKYIKECHEHKDNDASNYEDIKKWILTNNSVSYKEAKEEFQENLNIKTFYFLVAQYQSDMELIVYNIVNDIPITSDKLKIIESNRINELKQKIEEDLEKIRIKNICHTRAIAEIKRSYNLNRNLNRRLHLSVLKGSLFYYADGILNQHKQIENELLMKNLDKKNKSLEDNTKVIFNIIDNAHKYKFYNEYDIYNILQDDLSEHSNLTEDKDIEEGYEYNCDDSTSDEEEFSEPEVQSKDADEDKDIEQKYEDNDYNYDDSSASDEENMPYIDEHIKELFDKDEEEIYEQPQVGLPGEEKVYTQNLEDNEEEIYEEHEVGLPGEEKVYTQNLEDKETWHMNNQQDSQDKVEYKEFMSQPSLNEQPIKNNVHTTTPCKKQEKNPINASINEEKDSINDISSEDFFSDEFDNNEDQDNNHLTHRELTSEEQREQMYIEKIQNNIQKLNDEKENDISKIDKYNGELHKKISDLLSLNIQNTDNQSNEIALRKAEKYNELINFLNKGIENEKEKDLSKQPSEETIKNICKSHEAIENMLKNISSKINEFNILNNESQPNANSYIQMLESISCLLEESNKSKTEIAIAEKYDLYVKVIMQINKLLLLSSQGDSTQFDKNHIDDLLRINEIYKISYNKLNQLLKQDLQSEKNVDNTSKCMQKYSEIQYKINRDTYESCKTDQSLEIKEQELLNQIYQEYKNLVKNINDLQIINILGSSEENGSNKMSKEQIKKMEEEIHSIIEKIKSDLKEGLKKNIGLNKQNALELNIKRELGKLEKKIEILLANDSYEIKEIHKKLYLSKESQIPNIIEKLPLIKKIMLQRFCKQDNDKKILELQKLSEHIIHDYNYKMQQHLRLSHPPTKTAFYLEQKIEKNETFFQDCQFYNTYNFTENIESDKLMARQKILEIMYILDGIESVEKRKKRNLNKKYKTEDLDHLRKRANRVAKAGPKLNKENRETGSDTNDAIAIMATTKNAIDNTKQNQAEIEEGGCGTKKAENAYDTDKHKNAKKYSMNKENQLLIK